MSSQTSSLLDTHRQYLHVAQAILADIDSGTYEPGVLLPSDREIARAMSVSRPTVREALVALEVAGVVTSTRGSGVRVNASRLTVVPVDLPGVLNRPRELIEARCCTEPALVPLVVDRLTDDSLARLRQLADQFSALAAKRAASAEFARIGLEFHTSLAEMSGNSILASVIGNLASYELHPLWVLLNLSAMRSQTVREQQAAEHVSIVTALAARDAAQATGLLRAHLEGLRDLLFVAGTDQVPASAGDGIRRAR
jgi:GntR family transcriptional regulator, transcriptional repressor for pyruvate dehydrogenase complex